MLFLNITEILEIQLGQNYFGDVGDHEVLQVRSNELRHLQGLIIDGISLSLNIYVNFKCKW